MKWFVSLLSILGYLKSLNNNTIHILYTGKFWHWKKLAILVNHELIAKIFIANIHRYTKNVFGICTYCTYSSNCSLPTAFNCMVCRNLPMYTELKIVVCYRSFHFPTHFGIWQIKSNLEGHILLYISNGEAIDSLYTIKWIFWINDWLTSNGYFEHWYGTWQFSRDVCKIFILKLFLYQDIFHMKNTSEPQKGI